MQIFTTYIRSLAKTTIVEKTEHTDRGYLNTLLTEVAKLGGFNAQAINEQARQGKNKDGFGAPDFTVNHTEKHTVIGYIENKQIDENLSKILKSKQIEKYKKLSENLILTDYLEWIWIYKDSEPVRVRLCNSEDLYDKKFCLSDEKANEVYNLIAKFYSKEPDKIASAKILAEKLARPTVELKKYITKELEMQLKNKETQDELYAVYEIFRDGLFEELDTKDFADGFAQMLTYSIFLAKLNTNETLSIRNAKDHIPQAFSLIKTLSKFLDLLSQDKHKEVKWAVENILSVINNIDAFEVAKNLSSSNTDSEKDAYIYFYEYFLKEYDAESRVDRGVYYTPPAVVKFIVNGVSHILEEDFNLAGGLANDKVKLLDFACGTGTFLFESYKKVLEGNQKNSTEQDDLIEHLLTNFYGFEIMISSYIISHLKLSQFLKEQGYDIATKQDKRIGVYLTNTLENKKDIQTNLFAKAVAEEGREANKIKDNKEIIAIIGNPPYNVSSQNVLHDTNELLKFHNNYKPKDEKKLNIDDDYIKFMAFAHKKINDAGKGVIGVIVNNSFLKGLTHRKMRNELMKDFDKIYIIDLHGNARIGETAEDGSIDQNVFDIMQGVCIILLVKNKEIKNKGIFHIDLYGKRKDKFKRLYELKRKELTQLKIDDFNKAFRSTKWGKDRFIDDLSFFSPMREATAMLEYGKFWGLTDIFEEYVSGIETVRDNITIHYSKESLKSVLNDFQNLTQEQIKTKYKTDDARDWKISKAKDDVVNNINIQECYRNIAYKPFDLRYTFYTGKQSGFMANPRMNTMQHMLKGDNVGLVCMRGFTGTNDFNQIFITDCISDKNFYGFQSYLIPLYLHKTAKTEGLFLESEEKKPNFKPDFLKMIEERFGRLTSNPTQPPLKGKDLGISSNIPPLVREEATRSQVGFVTPEQILAFTYAQMHSPAYRVKYLELLKIDFPRINFDVSIDEFKRLARIGQELIDAHLMIAIPNLQIGSCISMIGFEKIICQKPTYNPVEQRIYLAKEIGKEVYFEGVSDEIWNFKIGGYQVLDKYLKERAERILTKEEIKNVSNIIKVLGFTVSTNCKIDLGIGN
jgi:predicted helicase